MSIELKEFLDLYRDFYKEFIKPHESNIVDEIINDIVWDDDIIIDSDNSEMFEVLLENSNIGKVQYILPDLMFLEKAEQNGQHIFFARNMLYNFYYAISQESGEIKIIDDDYDFRYRVAKDQLSFLRILKIIVSYQQLFFKGVPPDRDTILSFREDCISLAGGLDFKEYYDLVFATD